jgi:hypothetical protein
VIVNVAGIYEIIGSVGVLANAAGRRYCAINVDGNDKARYECGTNHQWVGQVSTTMTLAAGAVITLYMFQNSASTLATPGTTSPAFLAVSRVA